MRIEKNKLPFPHVIIHDIYTDVELKYIWRELEFLSHKDKLLSPDKTGSAFDDDGVLLKNNHAVSLDNVYRDYRQVSDILSITRKPLENLVYEVANFDFSFGILKECNEDYTILSYYEDSQDYKPHRDIAAYTLLTWFYKQPKQFDGGDIYFPEYDYLIEIKNNTTLFFMSTVEHQVFPVKMNIDTSIDEYGFYSCKGRYCISQFVNVNSNTK